MWILDDVKNLCHSEDYGKERAGTGNKGKEKERIYILASRSMKDIGKMVDGLKVELTGTHC